MPCLCLVLDDGWIAMTLEINLVEKMAHGVLENTLGYMFWFSGFLFDNVVLLVVV